MKIALAYILVTDMPAYAPLASRFARSYLTNPPSEKHSTIIICNGPAPDDNQRSHFSGFPDCSFLTRNNDGWDIGGYIEAAKACDADMLVCCGASTHFTKPGWLAHMTKVFQDSGRGFYGTCASYQVRPHLNTTGFFCTPDMLCRYPGTVNTKSDRYAFEHGPDSLWIRVAREHLPVKLVLWSGVHEWREWRKPANIYFRGDQSNCLAMFRVTDDYMAADSNKKRILSSMADTLTDRHFRKLVHNKNGEL